jgi:MSHA biogenesis protein MshJ
MSLRPQFEKLAARIDGMSLRERVLIFLAAAFLVVSAADALLLAPLLAQQKQLSSQVVQQQETMKDIQAQIAALMQAKQADASSPQRERIRLLRQQIADGEVYLKDRRDKLVPPDRMAALLEQVLGRNANLQLVAMKTLPVTPFIEPQADAAAGSHEPQMFKHGVTITVRGSYADVLQYLTSLERLPTRMFWGTARMNVIRHPTLELTLTLYTLSLDRTWMQV